MSLSEFRLPMRKIFGLFVVALFLMAVNAVPAAAHTGFESSWPSDGEAVDEPVSEITVTFSGPATPAGDGFVVLDASGTLREPDEVGTVDDLTWTLKFAEPLADGLVGVRWKVAAPDAHPIEGSFSFTVAASTATTTTEPTPTESDDEARPAGSSATTAIAAESTDPADVSTTVPTQPSESAAESTDPTTVSTAADAESTEAAADPATPSTVDDTESAAATTGQAGSDPTSTGDQTASAAPESPADAGTATAAMDDFLTTGGGSAVGANRLGDLGRVVTLFGAVFAIGGAVFAAKVLTATDAEMRGAVGWVRRGGVFLVVGSIIAAIAQIALLDASWAGLVSGSAISDALRSSFGLALGLRAVGGVLVAVGAQKGVGPAALLGLGLVVVSFLFDGHTVSEGPRWLHAIINVVHVSAAATWAGGILLLAWVLAGRRRRGVDLGALTLALRFSVVATAALVATAVAGTVLAIVILDAPRDLWSTPWGQLLIAKVVFVAVAAAGGGYNRQVVIPALERDPESQTLPDRFRTVVTLEAVALGSVTVVTAVLIAASST